jgi:uncharacterized protein (DUF488 family)
VIAYAPITWPAEERLQMDKTGITIWTVGHSNRPLNDFLELLTESAIEAVADVRRFPTSRKYPYFNREMLSDSLHEVGIVYEHFSEMGGRRRPRPGSHNTVWLNESFRGYADHLETEEFAAGAERLKQLALNHRTAVMCAEALWWRCHRSLIADYYKASGMAVHHILSSGKTTEHSYTSAARVIEGKLSYGS